MRKLIESAHVSLGEEIDPLDWAFPYLDDDHTRYATKLLDGADALLRQRGARLDLHAQTQGPLTS